MELKSVDITKCVESPTNPRGKKFEGPEFDDLVASVREKGVLMPILVREQQKGRYEVIAGNRRLRAASVAGLKDIPARIVEMSDTEAREAQIVENLQRADIHPLEEGEAYRQLIEESQYDIAAVAAKVGKSESYVRDRLVLTNLIKPGKTMFRDGAIHAGHASLVARLDEKQQKDALDWLKEQADWDNDIITATTKDLREWIYDRILQDSMANPPWQNDEEMKAQLGGCEECKGKGGDLFGKRVADACTNPKCYAQRLAAFIEIKVKENPQLVKLSGSYSNSSDLIGTSSYREIRGKADHCDHEEKGIIIAGNGIGHVKTICRAPECEKHWPTSKPGGHYKPTEKEKAARKKARQAEVKKRERDHEDTKKAVARMSWPMSEKHLDALVELALHGASHDVLQGVCKRREIEAPKQKDWHGRDYRGAIEKAASTMKAKEKSGLLFELLVPGYSPHYNDRPKWLKLV